MRDEGWNTMIAGVRCREVLAELSDYVDGALTTERVKTLQAHLAGCDRCARFGAEVSGVLAALRAVSADVRALEPQTSERLHARLAMLTRG